MQWWTRDSGATLIMGWALDGYLSIMANPGVASSANTRRPTTP